METEIRDYIDDNFSINTSAFRTVSFESADDNERAVVTIPLIHEGPNKKGLFWTRKILEEIAPMFRGLPFRYDLNGAEGSSHTVKKLSSPHYDVGWTYSDERGAWYKDGILWVKGEVTHPDVISKLKRTTSDNKREVNYASMGVFLESSKCSICGKEHGEEGCEHIRNQKYDGEICYSIPTKVKKALHAALTNDPADAEAEITNCIFQDLATDPSFRLTPNKFEHGYNQSRHMQEMIDDHTVNDMNSFNPNQNSMPNGMAPGFPQTNQPGPTNSSEMILKELAERIKTIEQHIDSQNVPMQGIPPAAPAPELINQTQNAGATQDNMGVTSQFDNTQQEVNNMNLNEGQNNNQKTDVNPSDKKIKTELQDDEMQEVNKLDQILGLLQQLVGQMPQTADMGKEALDASKGMAKEAQEDLPTEHKASPVSGGNASSGAESISDDDEDSNKKNKKHMMEPGKVATADAENAALKAELADMKAELAEFKSKFEFQDQSVPEFGGATGSYSNVEVADMSASDRVAKFGSSEAAFDAIFNGPESAKRFL